MPTVIIILGSETDLPEFDKSRALSLLDACNIKWELWIGSAHRHHDQLTADVKSAVEKYYADGLFFICAASMSATLSGIVEAMTDMYVPVYGVALQSSARPDARDAEESISRMPSGVPVSFMGIGKPGFENAAMQICQIVAMLRGGDFLAKYRALRDVQKAEKPFAIPLRTSRDKEAK